MFYKTVIHHTTYISNMHFKDIEGVPSMNKSQKKESKI